MTYVMLQPKMANRREEKVIVINGTAVHIADKAMNPCGGGFKYAEPKQLFEFAEESVRLLKSRVPSFLCDGLIRVDIFCNAMGKLMVNEFESLEATHYIPNHTNECRVVRALANYWIKVLNKCVQQLLFREAWYAASIKFSHRRINLHMNRQPPDEVVMSTIITSPDVAGVSTHRSSFSSYSSSSAAADS